MLLKNATIAELGAS